MITNQEQPLKVVRTHITGKIKIAENTQFNQIDAEYIEVLPGVRARVFGTVKDLVIHPECKVFIHGRITGTITNHRPGLRLQYLKKLLQGAGEIPNFFDKRLIVRRQFHKRFFLIFVYLNMSLVHTGKVQVD
jgi:hypothetical protein